MKFDVSGLLLLAVFSLSGAINLYESGFSYRYSYKGHVTIPYKDFPAGWKLQSEVDFEFVRLSPKNVHNVVMTLVSPKFQDYHGNSLMDNTMDKWQEPILLERFADGRIGKILTKPGHPTDILNLKRGIASLLQVSKATLRKGESSFSKEEKDVSGSCSYLYSVDRSRAKKKTQQTGTKYRVRKWTSFTKCTERPVMDYSVLDVNDCDSCDQVDAHIPKSSTETNCTVYNVATKPFIDDCHSLDKYTVNIDSNLAVLKVRRSLKLQSRRKMSKVNHLLQELTEDRKGLLFELERKRPHNTTRNYQKQSLKKIKKVLKELSQKTPMTSSIPDAISSDAPEQFLKLVEILRWEVDNGTFNFIYRSLYNMQQYSSWLRGALPFVSNELATEVIKKKIEQKQLKGYDVIQVLSRLAVTPKPNEKMCEHVLDICHLLPVKEDRNIYSTCWLAFGSLVHNAYREKLDLPKRFLEKIAKQYQRFAGGRNSDKFVVILKTIGNAGMKIFFTRLRRIISKRDKIAPPHSNIVIVSAIDALRRMRLNPKEKKQMKDTLQQVFTDSRSCPEIRTSAFDMLIKVRPSISRSRLAAISDVIVREKNQHVKNYVITYLNATIDSKQPCPAHEIRQAQLLMNFLIKRGHKHYKPSLTHSLHYKLEKISPTTGFPEECEVKKGYTHSSFIPRYLKIKYSKQLMGYRFPVHEFHMRQEGLLSLARNWFGPQGSRKTSKPWWNILRLKRSDKYDSVTEELRKMDKKLNMPPAKEDESRLSLSSKLFGSEIEYLVYDKNDKVLQALTKGGNIQVDKNWLQNSLQLGWKYDKRAMDLLFDGMRIIPTSMGLPLTLKLVVGGVLNHAASIQLTTKPLISLLTWNNRPTEIKGSFSVRPRAAVDSTGQMYLSFKESKLGLKHQANLSIFLHLNGGIDYNLQQQSYKHTLEVPDKRRTFFRSSSAAQIYTETKGKALKVKYIPFPLQHIGSRASQSNPPSPSAAPASPLLGLFSLRGSAPGVIPSISELMVEPTMASGYGLRFEIQNVTSDNTEKVFRIKLSRLGTSPFDQYVGELRLTKDYDNLPSSNIPDILAANEIANLTIRHSSTEWKVCLRQSLNLAIKKGAVNVSWGERCEDYRANLTFAFEKETKNSSLDVSLWWNKTPPQFANFHNKVCASNTTAFPAKRGSGLVANRGIVPNRVINNQISAVGQNRDISQGPGADPSSGKISSRVQQFYPLSAHSKECAKHVNLRITLTGPSLDIKSSFLKRNVMHSFPIPGRIQSGLQNYRNIKLMMEKFLLPEFPNCKVQFSANSFTSFDKRRFVYSMRPGCPHVLAKDVSRNNLFTVLLRRTRTNQHVVRVYLQGRNKRYDVFEINGNGHVLHMRKVPKFKQGARTVEMRTEDPGYWSLVKQQNLTKLQSDLGVEVAVRADSVAVTVSSWHYNMVRGLCGSYNDEPGDDLSRPSDDIKETAVKTFATSWMVSGKSCDISQSTDCSKTRLPMNKKFASLWKKCVGTRSLP